MHRPAASHDEPDLVARCLNGDAAAFEPLVERYHRPLFGAATRLLGSREAARDATQAAFLKAYEALGTFDPAQRFFSWIYRILMNECLNTLRASRLTHVLPDVAEPARPDGVEAQELRRHVRRALLQLPREQRDVIVLRHFAELSYEQVGSALGIAPGMVKSRLFAARQRLCELLALQKM